jgi:hypothetical protein
MTERKVLNERISVGMHATHLAAKPDNEAAFHLMQ